MYPVNSERSTQYSAAPNTEIAESFPGLIAAARSRIELPVPNVSPQLDLGGYVNLGMWLAVETATFAPLTAEAGPV